VLPDPPVFDPSQRDHRHDVRMFPVLAGARAAALASVRMAGTPTPRRRLAPPGKALAAGAFSAAVPSAPADAAHVYGVSRWLEEPAVVGLALMMLPPLGMTLLWSSPRFSALARAVLTLFTTLLFAGILLKL
jgi:hypothetical protein